MLRNKSVIFMGTSGFALRILEHLNTNKVPIKEVITQPDRPVGRKKTLVVSPVKNFAVLKKLKIAQFEKLNKNAVAHLSSFVPDIIIVAAYGIILPKKILDLPKLGCINIHASLLPKYRGPSPIQTVLLNGDHETGATIMLMDEGIDTGKIITSKKITISNHDTFPDLEQKIAKTANEILLPAIKHFIEKKIQPEDQQDSLATTTAMIKKNDGLIDWNCSAESIYNKHRAYFHWPKIFSFFTDKKIIKKITLDSISLVQISKTIAPGRVEKIDNQIIVGTKNGNIAIRTVTLEGTKKMNIAKFVNGRPHFINSTLLFPK